MGNCMASILHPDDMKKIIDELSIQLRNGNTIDKRKTELYVRAEQ